MKKIFAGLMIIGLIGMAAGTGTFAYFSDTETAQANTFKAGTVDISLSDSNGAVPFTMDNCRPGMLESKTVTVNNDGSLEAVVKSMKATSFAESDNDKGEFSGTNQNAEDVAKKINVVIKDGDNNEIYDGNLWNMKTNVVGSGEEVNIGSGSSEEFTFEFTMDSSVGNEFQGEGVEFDVEFEAEQVKD